MARSMQHILVTLYQAGARNVPGERLPWVVDDFPEINRAMNMAYLVRIERNGRSVFTLTRAGYHAIDQEPPPLTPIEILRSVGSWLLFGRSY